MAMNKSDFRKAAADAANDLTLARAKAHKAWLIFFNMVEPCSDEDGFKVLKEFRELVNTYRFRYKRKDVGVRHAANELFRLVCVGRTDATYDDRRKFIKWYGRLKSRITRAIAPLFDYQGDVFSDLCDLLPLADPSIVRRCLATGPQKREGFLTESELRQAVQETESEEWAKFILVGEEYVESTLESQAEQWFGREVRDEKKWTTEEQKELSWHREDDEDD